MAVRASQIVASISLRDVPFVFATQIVATIIGRPVAGVFVSQFGLNSLLAPAPSVRANQIALSILIWTHEVPMPALYPTLPGLAYSVIKRPKFFTGVGKSATGREVRVNYAANPLWEWDLTYAYLPDKQSDSAATASDLKELVGFYLSQNGSFSAFKFEDPDDNAVTAQFIGTTDGVTTTWILVRTYGGGSGAGTEPIGWVNTDEPFHVFLDGTLQDPSTYTLLTTIGVLQQLRFNSAPAAGHVITVTMRFYYCVHFSADTYDFEKFMDKLWSTQTITLASER